MKVLGIAGYSGAGKTTLLERLIPALRALGQRVSVVKHAHHAFEVDRPGKDSWRHRQAGALEVLVASDTRLALMREYEHPHAPDYRALVDRLDPRVDWVLVEGFKHGDLPKLEVWRPEVGKPVRYLEDAAVCAVAVPAGAELPQWPHAGVHRLDLDRVDDIALWLQQQGRSGAIADWASGF
ncbi:molybdopterin-guanine dinucleotide biosynthesis protein B [Comamonadaceae bacterium PP-2]